MARRKKLKDRRGFHAPLALAEWVVVETFIFSLRSCLTDDRWLFSQFICQKAILISRTNRCTNKLHYLEEKCLQNGFLILLSGIPQTSNFIFLSKLKIRAIFIPRMVAEQMLFVLVCSNSPADPLHCVFKSNSHNSNRSSRHRP